VTSAWTTYWVHSDEKGSTQVLTDSNGNEVQRFVHRPFGDRISTTNMSLLVDDTDFLGARRDIEDGLVYLGARYYDPVLGRFTAADRSAPTDTGVGPNRYAYSKNDPVNLADDGKAYDTVNGVYVSSAASPYNPDNNYIGYTGPIGQPYTGGPFFEGGIISRIMYNTPILGRIWNANAYGHDLANYSSPALEITAVTNVLFPTQRIQDSTRWWWQGRDLANTSFEDNYAMDRAAADLDATGVPGANPGDAQPTDNYVDPQNGSQIDSAQDLNGGSTTADANGAGSNGGNVSPDNNSTDVGADVESPADEVGGPGGGSYLGGDFVSGDYTYAGPAMKGNHVWGTPGSPTDTYFGNTPAGCFEGVCGWARNYRCGGRTCMTDGIIIREVGGFAGSAVSYVKNNHIYTVTCPYGVCGGPVLTR